MSKRNSQIAISEASRQISQLEFHLHKPVIGTPPDWLLQPPIDGETTPEHGISDDEKRPLVEVLAEFWEERSGILNWLIEGAIRYLTEGLVTPNEVKDATATYRSEQDPLQSFINACVDLVPVIPGQQPLKVAARTMYEAYCSWCVANSERPWSEKAFGQNLPQKGIAKIEGRIRQYVNVRLHDVPTTANRPNDDSSDDDEVPF
ncbi:primase-like DNA-binding domain-containing protein [Tardiphaga sp. 71_E8_N1_1]|uniref:primase-like DNA-binding domain-containing protein n=1 Tax=Tardiphaga sp. 71_E8_N1_1 TaxID=3240784 RepID=UPI003F89B940